MESTSTQKMALLVVSVTSFIMPLMLSGVNIAIPTIAVELGADAIALSWITTGYLLTSAIFLLPFGKLADIFGRKKMYTYGLVITGLTSLLSASSQSINFLILFRLLQGAGAAMLFTTGMAIISSIYPADRRGRAIGIIAASVYFGLTFGPLVGGWLTHHFSWRSVFLVHIPVLLLNIYLITTKLKGEWVGDQGQKFDLAGSVIYAVTIASLVFGFSMLPSLASIFILAMSVLTFIIFVRYEAGLEYPILEIKLYLSNKVFTYSCLASLINYTSTFGLTFLMSLYLQNIKGMSPQAAGSIMIVQPIIMALLSPYSGRLSDKYEPRYLCSTGMTLMMIGIGMLATLAQATTLYFIISSLVIIGAGVALFSSPNVNAIMGSVDKKYLGIASGSVSTTRVLGQMFSMAVVTLVFAVVMGPVHLVPENYPLLLQSIHWSFIGAACLIAFGIYFSLQRGNIR